MPNVTYLLGAGASFYSMPLQESIPTRMTLYREFIQNRFGADEQCINYINHLDELIKNVNESTSIDEYARSLFKARNTVSNTKLRVLKILLSDYLIFEQTEKGEEIFRTNHNNLGSIPSQKNMYDDDLQKLIRTKFDKRYRTFLNDVYDERAQSLKHGVNIISWNYDLQIEGSFCRDYDMSLDSAQRYLNVFPSKHFDADIASSKIIKLNGTAGVNYGESSRSGFENFITGFDEHVVHVVPLLIQSFHQHFRDSQINPTLTFGFENTAEALNARSYAKQVLDNTDILVIIGYSFPRVNSDIDREVLFSSEGEEFYLQVPNASGEIIRNNIRRIDPEIADALTVIPNCTQFNIP